MLVEGLGPMLGTVRKVGMVLDLFDQAHPEHGVSEVAKALGIPKSSTHLLLNSMTCIGLLRRTPGAHYRLGWRMLALGRVLLESTEARCEARQPMQALVARFRETVNLAVLEGDEIVYVEKLQGTSAVQVAITWVGKRLPAHCCAVGKVLLASRPWEEVLEIVGAQGLVAVTPHTITGMDKLRIELQQVAQQGYAYDREEVVLDLCCVAAPIRDHRRQVVAAMSLSVPAYRFGRSSKLYRTALVQACQETSGSLGYLPSFREGRSYGDI